MWKMLGIIFAVIAFLTLGGAVWWGVGGLFCLAFGINFQFTFLMGVACMFVVSIISGAFKKDKK